MTADRFAILAVCTANICRSPMMEVLLRGRLDPARFEVASAGVRGRAGQPMDAMSEMELMRLGASAGSFRSHPLDEYLVESADLIVTATRSHRSRVLEVGPRALRKTFTLREFAALCASAPEGLHSAELVADAAARRQEFRGDADVADPYRRSPKVHRATADQIAAAVDVIAARLSGSLLPGS
jgi:protein-tyrosine phosphatase